MEHKARQYLPSEQQGGEYARKRAKEGKYLQWGRIRGRDYKGKR
jgi:hypothetical protein